MLPVSFLREPSPQNRGKLMLASQQSKQVISEIPLLDFLCALETVICPSLLLGDLLVSAEDYFPKSSFESKAKEVRATALIFPMERRMQLWLQSPVLSPLILEIQTSGV